MSKIDELISKYCPNGVESVPLGDLLDYEQPTRYIVKSTRYRDNGTPVLTAGQTFVLGYTSETDGIFKASTDNPVIIFDDFTTSNQWVDFSFKVKSSAMKLLKTKKEGVLLRYVYYAMNTIRYDSLEHSRKWISIYSNIKIPLPPLSVQQEIVRILDGFSELEKELEKELVARRKQYEYYRNQLVSFGEGGDHACDVKRVKLGDIGVFVRGNGLQKSDFVESGTPCIHYGQIYTYYGMCVYNAKSFVSDLLAAKLHKAKYGDLIITTTSENIDDVGTAVVWLGEGEVAFGGHSCAFKHNQNPKYIAYLFKTASFFQQKKKFAKGVKVIDIKTDELAKIEIPLPSLAEQERIVAILDKFDALVNDISVGLPAELKARRKQYEYWRNKLLSFEEVA